MMTYDDSSGVKTSIHHVKIIFTNQFILAFICTENCWILFMHKILAQQKYH